MHHSEVGLTPVFNSHAIESALHKITDLAEHFVYLNDDIFVRRKLTPCHFFRDSRPIVRLGWHPEAVTHLFTDADWMRMMNATATHLEVERDMALLHVPYATTKRIMQDAEAFFGEEWASTATCKVRYQCEHEIAPIYASLRLALKRENATADEGSFVLRHANAIVPHIYELLRPFVEDFDVVCVSGFSGSRRELCAYLTTSNHLLQAVVCLMLVAIILNAVRKP